MLSTDSQNNPALHTPTRIQALRGRSTPDAVTDANSTTFRVNGRRISVGEVVTVPAHVARELIAVGKAKLAA